MGEGKDTDARVLGAKELDDGDAVGGDEGKLGEIEETEDGHLGTPAIEVVSTRFTEFDQNLPSNYWTDLKFIKSKFSLLSAAAAGKKVTVTAIPAHQPVQD